MQRSTSWKLFKHKIDIFHKQDTSNKEKSSIVKSTSENLISNHLKQDFTLQRLQHKQQHHQQEKFIQKDNKPVQSFQFMLSTISLPDALEKGNLDYNPPIRNITNTVNPTTEEEIEDLFIQEETSTIFDLEKENNVPQLPQNLPISVEPYSKLLLNVLQTIENKVPHTISLGNYNGVPSNKSVLRFNENHQRLIKKQLGQYNSQSVCQIFPQSWFVWIYDETNKKRIYRSIETENELTILLDQELHIWQKIHIMKKGLVPHTGYHKHGYLVNLESKNISNEQLLQLIMLVISEKIYQFETSTGISGISITTKSIYTRITLWFYPNPTDLDINIEVKQVVKILCENIKLRQVTLVNNDTGEKTNC